MARGDREYGGGASAPLLGGAGPPDVFVRERRRHDTWAAVVYWLLLGSAVVFGILGAVHGSPAFSALTSKEHLADARSCPAPPPGGGALGHGGHDGDEPGSASLFMAHTGVWLTASAAAALGLGLLFLVLLHTHPAALVACAVGVQVLLPLLAAGAAFQQGATPAGAGLLLSAGALALVFGLWREELKLVAHLLGVSARGLAANPGVVVLALVLQLALAGLGGGLCVAGFAAYTVGGVAPNPQALAPPAGGHTCRSPVGDAVPCCEWRVAGWVPVALATQGAALLWTIFLIFEIKVFVIAGACRCCEGARRDKRGGEGSIACPGHRC